ncbi:hypothetical protein RI129_004950 [Pyrocoelia pectoralis]|uniref:Nuclear pore protein n=1 Tax=Pyrocoelia pectoralis TaxID=417401 RepID=A0AAN7VK61_9COLE
MDNSDFSELLQEAEKLTSTIEGVSELPKVERSLRQVLEDSQDLYTRVAHSGTQDIHANLLLGSQGVDLPRIVQKLETISSKHTFEPLKPTYDTDVDSYLENHLQNLILGVVEQEFQKSADVIKSTSWEHQKSEWNQERMKIINAMTSASKDLLYMGNQPSIFAEPRPTPSNKLGYQEGIFASVVVEYNHTVFQGIKRPHLLKEFVNTARDFNNTKVNDMWEIMDYMTQLPALPLNECPLASRYHKVIIKTLVGQAKKYLEDRYKTYMTNVINENLVDARRGGVPGTYSLVRSFVGIRLQGEYAGLEGGMVDDRPVWPVVYYCIRSGDLSAALYCLNKAAFKPEAIVQLLEMKIKTPDSIEIPTLEANIQLDYRRLTHNSTDPFKRIVYDVLCCGETTDEHSEVAKTADDYLWLKLSYLRFDNERDDSELFATLQSTVLEQYGEVHYNAMNQPHVYFQVLALTGQFEAALEFLGRVEKYQIHGVHMAIALNEMHLLGLPKAPTSPLLCIDPVDPKPARRLNLCRYILIYVQKFELAAPEEAVNYYYMLKTIQNENENMFIKCIIDLAVETEQYQKLFGKMESTGMRSPGFLDDFVGNDIKIEDVVNSVGEALKNKGLFEEAIEVYNIINNQEEVLRLFCSLLPQVAHIENTDGSLRHQLSCKANEYAVNYSKIGYNCNQNVISTFLMLKSLLKFFDEYHTKEYQMALQTLGEAQLIPLHQRELEERVNAFDRLNTSVCKVLPDVILATINILFTQYQNIKANDFTSMKYQDSSKETQLEFLRQQAKVLTSFTGMLPYRMPGDINSRLVQMEILMH